jgi:hypothetical protein
MPFHELNLLQLKFFNGLPLAKLKYRGMKLHLSPKFMNREVYS